MTKVVIKLGLADLPQELRSLPERDRMAIMHAAELTATVDAHRWLQWSIRGGGILKQPGNFKPSKKPKVKKPTPKLKGAWKKLVQKVSKLKTAWKNTPPKPVKPKPKKKSKAARAVPAYRMPIDTGNYANSWTAEPTKNGMIIYNAGQPPIKAGVIEKGRRRGKGIPTAPLAEWVRRKLGVQDPAEAARIAKAISFAQKKRGRKGLHVLARAHPKIAEAMHKNVKKMLIKQAKLAASSYKAQIVKKP